MRPPSASPDRDGRERLQKSLARAGFGSRRAVETLIREGRVRVNGGVAGLGDRADPSVDRITLDGAPVASHPELRYFALNKPAGVTTTLRDPHAERSLAELLPSGPRVFPVGRLDRETEGLLLLTNDGLLAHRLAHPSFGVEKEYLVEVEGEVGRDSIRRLRSGVSLDDGFARPLKVDVAGRAGSRRALSVVMAEGRKREVRRMMAAVGLRVKRLVRVRVGPVTLRRLPPGEIRPLAVEEVTALYMLTSLDRAAPRPASPRTSERPSGRRTVESRSKAQRARVRRPGASNPRP